MDHNLLQEVAKAFVGDRRWATMTLEDRETALQSAQDGISAYLAGVNAGKLTAGPFQIDLNKQEVSSNGIKIKLGHRQFQVLAYLTLRKGKAVPRRELLRELWQERATFLANAETCLNVTVSEINKRLGARIIYSPQNGFYTVD